MRAKTTALVLMAIMAMVLIAMSASAEVACTSSWKTPAATGTTITGASYLVNISMACNATNDGGPTVRGNITSVNFSYKLTTDTAWTAINASNVFNHTKIQDAYGAHFRTNFNTAPLYDQLIYQFRATGYNGSGDALLTETTLATIYVDNHNPATPTFDTVKSNTRLDVASVVKGQVANASSCTIRVYDTGVTSFKAFTGTLDSGVAGSETCSYTFKPGDVTEGSKRQLSFTGSDLGSSADTTEGIVEYITFFKDSGSLKAAQAKSLGMEAAAAAEAAQNKQPTLAGIAIVGGLIYGAYYLFKRK